MCVGVCMPHAPVHVRGRGSIGAARRAYARAHLCVLSHACAACPHVRCVHGRARAQGTMCFRWVGVAPHADGDALPHPKADLLPLDELMRVMAP